MIIATMTSLEPGLTGTAERVVTDDLLAIALGSGDVPVFGTPALLALMEQAAVAALLGALPDGSTSVGASAELQHIAPTWAGATVRASARLVAVDGRKLRFEIEAHEVTAEGELKLIGRATHARAVVDRARFSV